MEARNHPIVRAAVIQHPPVFLNLQGSLDRAEALVAEASQGGARIVAFPETWLPGYPLWLDEAPEAAVWGHEGAKALYQLLTEQSIEIPGPAFERLRGLAGAHKVDLVMGAHERLGGTLYNTMQGISASPPSTRRLIIRSIPRIEGTAIAPGDILVPPDDATGTCTPLPLSQYRSRGTLYLYLMAVRARHQTGLDGHGPQVDRGRTRSAAGRTQGPCGLEGREVPLHRVRQRLCQNELGMRQRPHLGGPR